MALLPILTGICIGKNNNKEFPARHRRKCLESKGAQVVETADSNGGVTEVKVENRS